MTTLSEIWAVPASAQSTLAVLVLWTFALYGTALLPAQLFMRGHSPDLVHDRMRAYAWFYHRMVAGLLFGTAAWLGTWLDGREAVAYGFSWGRFERTVVLVGVVLLVALPLMALRNRSHPFKEHYPEIRIRRWTGRMISNNRTTWLIYVGAYESMLRGVLLFSLAASWGPAPAIATTVALDLSTHARRPASEVAARLPLSIVLSAGALWTGSILGPWLTHATLVLAAESLGRSSRSSI